MLVLLLPLNSRVRRLVAVNGLAEGGTMALILMLSLR